MTNNTPEVTGDLEGRLFKASIGSCNCNTKRHEWGYHDLHCHYRLFSECREALSAVPSEGSK